MHPGNTHQYLDEMEEGQFAIYLWHRICLQCERTQVYDVTLLQLSFVWYAVIYDFIY
jgi:hypothetical protein